MNKTVDLGTKIKKRFLMDKTVSVPRIEQGEVDFSFSAPHHNFP